MNKKILIILIVLIAIISLYFLLRGTSQTQLKVPVPGTNSSTIDERIVSENKSLTILGDEYSFSPSSINVEAGEQVTILFKNIGRAPHNLTIEGLGISTKTIGGGQEDIIEFIAPATGTYTFYCSVGAHRAAGMVGSLEVN